MLISLLGLVCMLLCILNLSLIVYNGIYTPDHLLSSLCALLSLILIFFTREPRCKEDKGSRAIEDVILSKQLQIINWKALYTKATASYRIQRTLYYRNKNKPLKRSSSDPSIFKSNAAHAMKSWSSWNDSFSIQDPDQQALLRDIYGQ